MTEPRRRVILKSMQLLQYILRFVRRRELGSESKRHGLEELVERHRASLAAQTPALSAAAGAQSWHDIALSAIEHGDEAFAGEIVGLVEQQLRRMS